MKKEEKEIKIGDITEEIEYSIKIDVYPKNIILSTQSGSKRDIQLSEMIGVLELKKIELIEYYSQNAQ